MNLKELIENTQCGGTLTISIEEGGFVEIDGDREGILTHENFYDVGHGDYTYSALEQKLLKLIESCDLGGLEYVKIHIDMEISYFNVDNDYVDYEPINAYYVVVDDKILRKIPATDDVIKAFEVIDDSDLFADIGEEFPIEEIE